MVKTIGKYEIHKTLGEGSFGKVKFGVNKETGEEVAIKILDKDMLRKKNMSVQIKREISLMRLITHPNVIQIKDVFATENKIFMVLELVEGGELFDKIVEKGRFTPAETRFYIKQLISGMETCHSQGICHRDLKPENLLLDAKGNLKISDFGMARLYVGDPDADGEVRSELLHTTCGTPNYVAPEVLTLQGYDGQKADVWSIGVILFVLLAGYLPFEEATTAALFKKIKAADYSFPAWFLPEVRDVVAAILVVNPERRFGLQDLKNSAFMTNPDCPELPPFPLPSNHKSSVHSMPDDDNDSKASGAKKEKKKSRFSGTFSPRKEQAESGGFSGDTSATSAAATDGATATTTESTTTAAVAAPSIPAVVVSPKASVTPKAEVTSPIRAPEPASLASTPARPQADTLPPAPITSPVTAAASANPPAARGPSPSLLAAGGGVHHLPGSAGADRNGISSTGSHFSNAPNPQLPRLIPTEQATKAGFFECICNPFASFTMSTDPHHR